MSNMMQFNIGLRTISVDAENMEEVISIVEKKGIKDKVTLLRHLQWLGWKGNLVNYVLAAKVYFDWS